MLTFADIFVGCGGLSHSFYKDEDYQGILAIDHWSVSEKVFTSNHPDMKFKLKDMYNNDDIQSVADTLRGKCDVLLGGPPCQGFSSLGKRRDDDKRSTLVETFLKLALDIKPKVIIMENVRGITSKKSKAGNTFPALIKSILDNDSSSSYDLDYVLINTLDYGLAQTRVRWIMIAVRKDINKENKILSNILNAIESQKTSQRSTLRDVIGDLPYIESGQGQDEFVLNTPTGKKVIYNHVAMNHSKALIKRLSYVPTGGGLLNVPKELLTNHLLRMVGGHYGNGGHIKNIYGRLDWNKPCGTVVAGIDKITCGRFVHPDANRLLTPRECARIQSFPDDFRFYGSLVNQYYSIGNAVPPKVSRILSQSIRYSLKHKH